MNGKSTLGIARALAMLLLAWGCTNEPAAPAGPTTGELEVAGSMMSLEPIAQGGARPSLALAPATTDAACTLPMSSLVSWWAAEGDALDSKDGNHGSLMGGTSYGPGQTGESFLLDGVDDYVHIANGSSMDFGAQDFTIELYFNLNSLKAEDMSLFNKQTPPGVDFPATYLVELDPLGEAYTLRFLVRETLMNENDLIVPFDLEIGRWYHVIAERHGNRNRLYLDDNLIGERTSGLNVNTGQGGIAAIGKLATFPARYVPGRIDEVRIYGSACLANPRNALADLIEDVEALGTQGVLGGETKSLVAKLEAVAKLMDGGAEEPATNLLLAFVLEVEAFIASGRLTSGQADPLVDDVQSIVDQLGVS